MLGYDLSPEQKKAVLQLNSERIPRGLSQGKRANTNKTLPCNGDSPRLTPGSLQSDSSWSIKIDNEADGWSVLHLKFPRNAYERIFYFQDDYFVTPIRYFSRGFSRQESRFFRFLVEDSTVFNPAAAEALDSFVLEAARQLELDENALALLEREKILYLHCRNPESIERFTGFKIRGMGVLSHDCIITTFSAHYHEVAHLLIAFKLRTLGAYSHPLLGEGLAVALGGRGGRDAPVMLDVGYYLVRSGLVDIDALFNEKSFIAEEISFSYPSAGLYVRYLLDTLGNGAFLKLYRKYCRTDISDRNIDISSEDIPADSLWNKWLGRYKQFASLELLNKLPESGEIILEQNGAKVIDCGEEYCFLLKDDIFFSESRLPEGYRSTRFEQLYPDGTYNGERYLVAVQEGEIGIYDLYLNTLLINRASSFEYPSPDAESITVPVIFSVEKFLFQIPLPEMTPAFK